MSELRRTSDDSRITDLATRTAVLEEQVFRGLSVATEVHTDHEKRLRKLERAAWATLGTSTITFLAVLVRILADYVSRGGVLP